MTKFVRFILPAIIVFAFVHAEETLPKAAPETSDVLVFLKPGTDAAAYARQNGLTLKRTLKSDQNAHVFSSVSPDAAKNFHARTKTDAAVRNSLLDRPVRYRKFFTPDDAYFHKNTPTNGFPGEWHLSNEIVPGRDANVLGAWSRNLTGEGVIIGIVDDSVQPTHPDIQPNYSATHSYDFGQDDPDPSPVYSDDEHGCSTSGVAAARGGDGTGVTGAAPFATIAGLRVDFRNGTESQFFDATNYLSDAIRIKNHSYGGGPYEDYSLERQAITQSAALGVIHCWAAGNGSDGNGTTDYDANRLDLGNCVDAICCAAFGSDGQAADYSCFGSCVFVTAPSSTATGFGITTTDRMGNTGYNANGSADGDAFPDTNYTSDFGGTSSATPLVAGVLALVKQVRPNLDTRFAKHLLVKTSTVVDSGDNSTNSDGGWRTNAAGNKFNQSYGFGLVNADKLTQEALNWSGVTTLQTETTGTVTVGASIPDNNATGVSRSFTLNQTTPLETVIVHLTVTHPYASDIEAFITAPSGYKSRLISRTAVNGGANIDWTYITNALWGENPAGTWTLQVRDSAANRTGTWVNYRVTTQMGTLIEDNSQKITFDPIPGKTFGDAPFTVSASASSGLPVSFSIVSGPATISGNLITLNGGGTVAVRASQPGDGNTEPAQSVDRSFVVAKAPQMISFDPIPDKVVGDPHFDVHATATSNLTVTFSIVTGSASVVGNSVAVNGMGLVIVRASQSGNSNFSAAPPVEQSFNVTPASQSISFSQPANHTFGDPTVFLSAQTTSGLPVSFDLLSGSATISGNQVTLTGAGTVSVRASQAGNNEYGPAPDVDRSFGVAKGNQTISFTQPANKTFGDAPFSLSATATSGLAIAFSLVSGPATLVGNQITISGAGDVVVRAAQTGDSNYNAATPVDRTFVVAKASQTITFDEIADRDLDESPFTLNPTSTSGLPVALEVINGAAEASSNSITLLAGGLVVILATQPGNANFDEAPAVVRSFHVFTNHRPALVSPAIATPNPSYAGVPVRFIAVATDADGESVAISWDFKDGSPIKTGSPVTHQFSAAGTYDVVLTLTDGIESATFAISVVIRDAISAPVAKGSVKFTFTAVNKDAFSLSGSLPLAAGKSLSAKTLDILIADFSATGLTFSDKSAAASGKSISFKVTGKADRLNGGFAAGTAKFSLAIKSMTLFDKLASAGFVNDDVTKRPVPLTSIFIIDGAAYTAQKTFVYSAKKNKSGAGK